MVWVVDGRRPDQANGKPGPKKASKLVVRVTVRVMVVWSPLRMLLPPEAMLLPLPYTLPLPLWQLFDTEMVWFPPRTSPRVRPTDVFETAETLFEHEFDGAAFAIPAVAAIPVPITATVTAARLTMFFTVVPPGHFRVAVRVPVSPGMSPRESPVSRHFGIVSRSCDDTRKGRTLALLGSRAPGEPGERARIRPVTVR